MCILLYCIRVTDYDSYPAPEQETPASEHFLSSLELKELLSVFAEAATDEETVVRIIEDALREPIPDLNDPVAVDEFNAKMIMLQNMTEEYIHRSAMLRDFRARLSAKVEGLPS